MFDALNGVSIRCAALRTKGAAGPSGVDAFCWRRLCTSFRQASDDLCASLALVARRLCTDMVDPVGLTAFVACHNNNNNNNKLYSVHIPTYIQVADVGMIQLGHMAAH